MLSILRRGTRKPLQSSGETELLYLALWRDSVSHSGFGDYRVYVPVGVSEGFADALWDHQKEERREDPFCSVCSHRCHSPVAGSGSGFLFLALLFLPFSARKKPAPMREPVLLFRVHRGNSVPAVMPESVRL